MAWFAGMRILASSLSAEITFHNEEYRPKNGFCVANHTTPFDVTVLSTDCVYSLVILNLIEFTVQFLNLNFRADNVMEVSWEYSKEQ